MPQIDLPPTLESPPDVVVPAPVAVRRGRAARFVGWAALAGFGAIFGLVRTHRTDAVDREFANVFVCRFDDGGRCREFTEWYMRRRPAAIPE